MQAIITKYLPATNFRGSRVKASCQRAFIIVDWDHANNPEQMHIAAAQSLIRKFLAEDKKRYPSDASVNPWSRKRCCGQLPDGSYAHVFCD